MPIKSIAAADSKRKPNTFITNTKNSSIQQKVIIIERKKRISNNTDIRTSATQKLSKILPLPSHPQEQFF